MFRLSEFFDVGGSVNQPLGPGTYVSPQPLGIAVGVNQVFRTHLENEVAIGQDIFLEQSFLVCGRTLPGLFNLKCYFNVFRVGCLSNASNLTRENSLGDLSLLRHRRIWTITGQTN